MLRMLTRLAVAALLLLAALCAAAFALYRQPPEVWSSVVAKAPGWALAPTFPIMSYARKGSLEVGDPATDFELQTHDHSASVRLSDYQGDRPVALVFGSYT